MSEEQGPGTAELARLIERNHKETSADIAELKAQSTRDLQTMLTMLNSYVLVKVYEVQTQAFEFRLSQLEERQAQDRKYRIGLLTALIAAIVGAIAATVGTVVIHGG